MREQKKLIKLFAIALIIAIIIFTVLLLYRLKFSGVSGYLNRIQMCGDIMNLIIGLFSGVAVALALAVEKYFSEKRRIMTDIYIELIDISNLFVAYSNARNIRKKEECIKNIAKYDKRKFNLLIGSICFLFNNKKHYGDIYKKIYCKVNGWFSDVQRLDPMINDGLSISKEQINELDALLLENGETKFKKLFNDEINGWFYELAFNKTYEEDTKNAD